MRILYEFLFSPSVFRARPICPYRGFYVFPHSLQSQDGAVPQIGHNCFLRNPLQFIVRIVALRPVARMLKASLNYPRQQMTAAGATVPTLVICSWKECF
jgi:hypothetical protein